MCKIAEEYPNFEFVQQAVAQIPWGHNIVLLDKVKNIKERKWYIQLKLKCYIVVELKAREFEPTDAGQLNFHLSAIDDLVKDENDNPSIGLLLCKTKDKFAAEYALKDINKPI